MGAALVGGGGPAREHPGTRRALRRWRRAGLILVAIGAVPIGVAVAATVRAEADYDRIVGNGVAMSATVIDVEQPGRGLPRVVYRYDWETEVHTDGQSVTDDDGYHVGQRVGIYVDRDNPADTTLADGPAASPLEVFGVIAGVTLWAMAILVLWAYLRRWRVARVAPWREVQLVLNSPGHLRPARVEVTGDDGERYGLKVGRFGRYGLAGPRWEGRHTLTGVVARRGRRAVISTTDTYDNLVFARRARISRISADERPA